MEMFKDELRRRLPQEYLNIATFRTSDGYYSCPRSSFRTTDDNTRHLVSSRAANEHEGEGGSKERRKKTPLRGCSHALRSSCAMNGAPGRSRIRSESPVC